MFIGEFRHSIDAKGRLILPSRFRDELGESCVITLGYDGCLDVYPAAEWEKFAEQLRALNIHNPAARRIVRTFVSHASACEPDKQGRVLLSPAHRSFLAQSGDSVQAEKTDVVLIGSIDKIEIWRADQWERYNEDEEALSLEEAGERLAELK